MGEEVVVGGGVEEEVEKDSRNTRRCDAGY